MKPDEIEKQSFEIIDSEAGTHSFSPEEWEIVRRMIHTTADFEYMNTVRFHPKAIEAGIRAISQGKTIVTDTNMAMAGIRRRELESFGVAVKCFISDSEAVRIAAEKGMTRAEAATDLAAPEIADGICVIGNAPTALLRLMENIREKKATPALIVGLPVGFVNATESKAELIKSDYPYISNVGRKGGSNLAASVINALIKIAVRKS